MQNNHLQTQPSRPPTPILVFDIETVPDIPLVESSYDHPLEGTFDVNVHWKELRFVDAVVKQNEIRFLAPAFQNVVSICAVFVHPTTYQIIDGFRKTIPLPENYEAMRLAERQLLSDFWTFANKYKEHSQVWYDSVQSDFRMSDYQRKKIKPIPVTFCGYNINDFDLPVIEQRSLRNLLTCPIADYAKDVGTDGYRYKFALDKCFDLCQFVSNFNPSARARLDVLARSMGLGGKMEGMDGSRVAPEYFENHAWDKIEEYCAVDVLITYGLLLAIQKFRGLISESEMAEAATHFERFLTQDGKPAAYKALFETSDQFFKWAKAAQL